jgi:hypothetical protein
MEYRFSVMIEIRVINAQIIVYTQAQLDLRSVEQELEFLNVNTES